MSDFAQAARQSTRALRALFPKTPLQRNDHLSQRYGAEIWLKREDLSPVRSYKLRGAFTAMRKSRSAMPDQQQFVCASAGNHAQGVAFAEPRSVQKANSYQFPCGKQRPFGKIGAKLQRPRKRCLSKVP